MRPSMPRPCPPVVSATPDAADRRDGDYAPGTRRQWRYVGRPATQTWRCDDPDPRLRAWVRGRFTYWASTSPISGGVSFENFEMFGHFRQGQELRFAVEPIADPEAAADDVCGR